MNDCGNCRHTNHLDLPDFSTMPCAACARYGADNDPTMWEAKPITNADRIRAMTDEELAAWFIKIQDDTADYIDGQYSRNLPATSESWALWLKGHADKEESQ